MNSKVIIIVLLAVLAGGAYWYHTTSETVSEATDTTTPEESNEDVNDNNEASDSSTNEQTEGAAVVTPTPSADAPSSPGVIKTDSNAEVAAVLDGFAETDESYESDGAYDDSQLDSLGESYDF